jgi:hypothetical protein
LSVRAGLLALSNDVIVSASNESNGRPSGAQDATSILSNLPRTRPQRATARRTAARKATASTTAAAPAKPRARRAPVPTPDVEPVPLQGFESEHDRARGPVHPPGGVELVASAAEIVGELAKAGLSTGERLLKDLLSRLPLA